MRQARRKTMNNRKTQLNDEPTLAEMLADPVIRARMAVDGVSDDDITALMRRPWRTGAAA